MSESNKGNFILNSQLSFHLHECKFDIISKLKKVLNR